MSILWLKILLTSQVHVLEQVFVPGDVALLNQNNWLWAEKKIKKSWPKNSQFRHWIFSYENSGERAIFDPYYSRRAFSYPN